LGSSCVGPSFSALSVPTKARSTCECPGSIRRTARSLFDTMDEAASECPSPASQWFRKSPGELHALFDRSALTWERVAEIISEIRNGDYCIAATLRRGWELFVQKTGCTREAVSLLRLLAEWAIHGAAFVPLEKSQVAHRWRVSAVDARNLMANAFWGNLLDPTAHLKERRNLGGLSFARLYDGHGNAVEKCAGFWNYFDAAENIGKDDRWIEFEPMFGRTPLEFRAALSCPERHCALRVNVHAGVMEDVEVNGFMNFANKNFGYGKIIPSTTQEEVLQVCHPEFNIGMLIYGQLAVNEAIVVRNVRRFSTFTPGGKFSGRAPGDRRITILTADACLEDHFGEENNWRDVQKACLAFCDMGSVSTGRWGCGAFGGDVQHKLLQQIIAARISGLEVLHFAAFHDAPLEASCRELAIMCVSRSTQELVSTLEGYSEFRRASVDRSSCCLTVAQYMQLRFASDGKSRCILLSHGSFNPVHKHHVEMMVRAKCAAEKAGYVVVKGILAPTAEACLQYKCGADVLQAGVRMQALGAAILPHHWLEVDPRGMRMSTSASMLRQFALPELEPIGKAVGFCVQGGDAGEPRRHGAPCIVVDRVPSSISKERQQELNEDREHPHIFLEGIPGVEISSTRVRRALRAGAHDEVSELCGAEVAKVLHEAVTRRSLWLAPPSRGACERRKASEPSIKCTIM